jgi:SAM-dependent methyltransferase
MNIYKEVSISGRVRHCIELLKSQNIKGKFIVDVGCSNGLIAHHALPLKPKKFVVIDPSSKAVNIAKKNNKSGSFFQSTAAKLPVKDNTADLVLMFDVIEHVPVGTELEALSEAARVLRKKGRILLSTPNNHWLMNLLDPAWYLGHRHYKLNKIKEFIRIAGFKVESAEVRGGVWFSIYLLVLYFFKWVLKKPQFRNRTLETLDDRQFSNKGGMHTIFIVATKK